MFVRQFPPGAGIWDKPCQPVEFRHDRCVPFAHGTPVRATERRVWPDRALICCCGRLVFGASEVQPIEGTGCVKELVILCLRQYSPLRKYANYRSLVALQMVVHLSYLVRA